jgi:hypothetical protein
VETAALVEEVVEARLAVPEPLVRLFRDEAVEQQPALWVVEAAATHLPLQAGSQVLG